MYKKMINLIFVTFLLMLSHSYSQVISKSEIPWDSSIKLTWNDYKIVKSKSPSIFSAVSRTYVNYSIEKVDKKCLLNIQAIFNKNNSWVNSESVYSENLLSHEQNHFNIEEVVARMFRKKVIEQLQNEKCPINLKKLKSKYVGIANKLHGKYDKKTNYSLDKESQIKWQGEIIPKMLEDLKEYSSSKVEISRCDCIY